MKFVFSLIIIFSLLSSPLLTFSLFSKSVYGDGLFMEELGASLGDRTANLLIRMSPPARPPSQPQLMSPIQTPSYLKVK